MKSVYTVMYRSWIFGLVECNIRHRSKERAIINAKKWCKTERAARVVGWHSCGQDDLESCVEWDSGVDNV